MTNNQEWFNKEFLKDSEDIEIEYEAFEGSLIIEDYPNLKDINISDVKKIEKIILKNLPNLESFSITNCKAEKLVIENCPKLRDINVRNNFLSNLEFTKDLTDLLKLEIDGNEKIVSGAEFLPDSLANFSCKGTDLFKLLDPHKGDWKKYKQYLKEQGISEEENNRRELLSLREENKKLEIKNKIFKEKFQELSSLITSLKSKIADDETTKEIINNLEKNVRDIVDESIKLKDELEQFRPLFNEEAPIIQASKLGEGSFGVVYKGVWKTQFAAVKKAFTNINDETELAEVRKELKILKNLRSSYTIQYYGEYQKDNDIYIIMELAEHGSLADFIKKNKGDKHDWQLNYKFIRQMVKGLRYLHSEGVLHRDLKSGNVLITEGYVAKLSDFGLAKLLDSSHKSSSGEKLTGTLRWLAPEVLRNSKHSYYSDIYSLGMVMWEITAKNTKPFKDLDNDHAVIFQVGNGLKETIASDTPNELAKIIQLCWEEKPEKRISLNDIENKINELIIERTKLEAKMEFPPK